MLESQELVHGAPSAAAASTVAATDAPDEQPGDKRKAPKTDPAYNKAADMVQKIVGNHFPHSVCSKIAEIVKKIKNKLKLLKNSKI